MLSPRHQLRASSQQPTARTTALVVAHKSAPPMITAEVSPKDPYKKFEALILEHFPDPQSAPKILEPEPGQYRCSFCSNAKSGCKFNIWTHIKSIHLKLKDFQCAFCSFEASRKYSLDTHFRKSHLKLNGNFIPCPACDFKSTSLNLFIIHSEKHHGLENLIRLECTRDPQIKQQLQDMIEFRRMSKNKKQDSFLNDYMRKVRGTDKRPSSSEDSTPASSPKRPRMVAKPKARPVSSSESEGVDTSSVSSYSEDVPHTTDPQFVCLKCKEQFAVKEKLTKHLFLIHSYSQYMATRTANLPESKYIKPTIPQFLMEPRIILKDIQKSKKHMDLTRSTLSTDEDDEDTKPLVRVIPEPTTPYRKPGPKSKVRPWLTPKPSPSALEDVKPSLSGEGARSMVAKKSSPSQNVEAASVTPPVSLESGTSPVSLEPGMAGFVAKKSVPSEEDDTKWLDEAINNTMDMSLENLNALADTFEDSVDDTKEEDVGSKENVPKKRVKWHKKTHYECFYCEFRSLKMTEFTEHFNEGHRGQILTDTAHLRKPKKQHRQPQPPQLQPVPSAEAATSFVVNFENM